MKRKLIKRNKNYISSTMRKYDGNLSWQRVCQHDFNGEDFDSFCEWLMKSDKKTQWRYSWLTNSKLFNEIICMEHEDYDY